MKIPAFVFIFLFFQIICCADPTPNQTVQIRMRDGASLTTDIYLPQENSSNLPCILIRSPSGRRAMTALRDTELTKEGFMVVIQETRSAQDTEGKTVPYTSDGWADNQDGYDTVEWLAKNPMTNGKIGTLGSSALGITQLLMAPSAPPHLVCQYIGVATPSLHQYAIFPNGKLLKHQVESWLGYYARDTGISNFITNQHFYTPFWEDFDSLRVVDKVQAPAILQGGWYDMFIQGTLDAFVARQDHGGKGAKGKQKLLVGPWMHFWPATTKLGDFEVPLLAQQPPVDYSPKRWFDYYLKGIPNGANELPPVTYYVMGPFDGSPSSGNIWRTANAWPVPAINTPFYLATEGRLIADNPPQNTSTASYVHDPANPVPTLGGLNLFMESGPVDQRPNEARDDVLTFTTPPLTEDVEITGRMHAYCFLTSDVTDTDIAVRLCDVYPDGRSILIADGIFRTGIVPHTQGVPLEASIDLWSTSLVFAKGHQIRISISGSNYPRYENNPNIGLTDNFTGKAKIAHNEIHLGGSTPSRVVLPIVRMGDRWLAK